MIDVVYTLGTGSKWQNREILYSLRSFEKHFQHIGQVWIVGQLPHTLHRINHIPFPDPYKQNKDANKINKVIRACFETEVSDRFIWCCDDQCLLKDVDADSFGPCFVEDLDNIENWGSTQWINRLRNTYERLLFKRLTRYNLEAHTPLLIDKSLFPRTMLQFDYGAGHGYNLTTLYYNSIGTGGRPRDASDVRAGFFLDEKLHRADIESRVTGKIFLAYNDSGLSGHFEEFLEHRFPEPSQFERVQEEESN